MKLRVVLERVRILNDRDPAMEPLRFGESRRGVRAADNRLVLDVDVHSRNGHVRQRTRLPDAGYYRPYSLYSIPIDQTVFDGEVEDHLVVTVRALPPNADRDRAVSTYTREFVDDPRSWLGRYEPHEASGPEHLGFWQVVYRIEAAGSAAH